VGRRVARSRGGHQCGARGGTDLGRSRGRAKVDGAPPRREARVRKRASERLARRAHRAQRRRTVGARAGWRGQGQDPSHEQSRWAGA
jgi:hypothetical protein